MRKHLDQLIAMVTKKSVFQGKYLRNAREALTEEELADCERLMDFYLEHGETADTLAEAYLLIVNDTVEETKFFMEHG